MLFNTSVEVIDHSKSTADITAIFDVDLFVLGFVSVCLGPQLQIDSNLT